MPSEVRFPVVIPIKVSGDAKFNSVMDRVGQKTSAVHGRVSMLQKAVVGLFAGVSAAVAVREVTRFAAAAVDAAQMQAMAEAQVAAAIASTSAVAGISAAELGRMATAYQDVTNFGDEVTLMASAQLLTFTKINKDLFPETIGLAQDLSVRFGTDMKSGILQLGKAMNDLSGGALSALKESGIDFQETQLEMIKGHFAAGRAAEGQRIILDELQKQVGGSARAQREASDGSVALANAYRGLHEAVGEELLPDVRALNTSLIELVEDVGPSVVDIVGKIAAATRGASDAFGRLDPKIWEGIKKSLPGQVVSFWVWELGKAVEFLGEQQDITVKPTADLREEIDALAEFDPLNLDALPGIIKQIGDEAGAAAPKAETAAEAIARLIELSNEGGLVFTSLLREGGVEQGPAQLIDERLIGDALAELPRLEEGVREATYDVIEFEAIPASGRWVDSLWLASDAFAGMNNQVGDLLSGLARAAAIAIEMAREIGGVGGAIAGILNGLSASGIGFGSTGDSILSGAAGGASIGAMFGPGGAVTGAIWGAVAGAITDFFDETAQTYGRLASEAGRLVPQVLEGSGKLRDDTQRLLDGIANDFNAIADLLGADSAFAAIGVQIREDSKGIRVWVEDVLIGTFQDLQEAQEAGVLAAVQSGQFDGISPVAQLAIDEFTGSTLGGLMDAIERSLALVDPSSLVASYNTLFGIEEDAGDVVRAKIMVLKAEVEVQIAQLKAEEARLQVLLAGTEVTVSAVEGLAAYAEVIGATGVVAGASAEVIAGALETVGEALATLEALDFSPEAINAAVDAARAAAAGAGRGGGTSLAGPDPADLLRQMEIMEALAAGHVELAAQMQREDEIARLVAQGLSEAEAARYLELEAMIAAREEMERMQQALQGLAEQAQDLLAPGGAQGGVDAIRDRFNDLIQDIFQGIADASGTPIHVLDIIRQFMSGDMSLERLMDLLGQYGDEMGLTLELQERMAEALEDYGDQLLASLSPTLAAMQSWREMEEALAALVDPLNELGASAMELQIAAQDIALGALGRAVGFFAGALEGIEDPEARARAEEALLQLQQMQFQLEFILMQAELAHVRAMLAAQGLLTDELRALFDLASGLGEDVLDNWDEILDGLRDSTGDLADEAERLAETVSAMQIAGASAGDLLSELVRMEQGQGADRLTQMLEAFRDLASWPAGNPIPGFEDYLEYLTGVPLAEIEARIAALQQVGGSSAGQTISDILGELGREVMPTLAGNALDLIDRFSEYAAVLEAQGATEGDRLLLMAHLNDRMMALNDQAREGIRQLAADIQIDLLGPRAAFAGQQGAFQSIFSELLGASDLERLDLFPQLARAGSDLRSSIASNLGGAGTTAGGRALRDLADALAQADELPGAGVDPNLSALNLGNTIAADSRDIQQRMLDRLDSIEGYLTTGAPLPAPPPVGGGGEAG